MGVSDSNDHWNREPPVVPDRTRSCAYDLLNEGHYPNQAASPEHSRAEDEYYSAHKGV